MRMSGTYLIEPVVELLGTGLTAEIPSCASKLSGDAFLTELVTVVAAYTLQTQPLDKILLKQQLTSWEEKSRNILKERWWSEIKSTTMQSKNHLCAATKESRTFAAEWPLDSWELDRLVQRLLFLAVLAKSHNAVELLVVLTANLTAELIYLFLRVNRFTLIASGTLKRKNTRLQGKSEPVVLRYGGAMISKLIIIIIKMTPPTPTFAAVFVHFLLQQSLSRLLHLNCFLVLVLFNLLNLRWISAACVSRKGGLTSHSRVSGFRLKAPRQ